MSLFHIKYPANTGFLTWDDLGCLSRALGFPSDLFKTNYPADSYEFKYDERGIGRKTMLRLLDECYLYTALHRSYNMHTAEWNARVFVGAIEMLEHKVLDFEGLYKVRIAYATYEHGDMKGMLVNKHVLLRTLKMCGRTIAPLKLAHRMKHMRSQFDERGRIQLYELFRLLLWCDVYTAYCPLDQETASGKDDYLFKLVDPRRLFSHHDQRLANQLNEKYFQEELDYGKVKLGSRQTFSEPIVKIEIREQQSVVSKQNYHQLKNEINQSEKRVHQASVGGVRARPISAPNLENLKTKSENTNQNNVALRAYEKVKQRLHSAPSREQNNFSDRPNFVRHKRAFTPRVVTPADIEELQTKIEELNFDITTLDCRCTLQVEEEMDFYLPGYKNKPKPVAEVRPPTPEPIRKPQHWTSGIIKHLAYPSNHIAESHDSVCDARYRGWSKVNKRSGYHVIVNTTAFENSERGRLMCQMENTTMSPVHRLHPGYLLRYTPKGKSRKSFSRGGKAKDKNKFSFRCLKKTKLNEIFEEDCIDSQENSL
ncbi:uncharacterized protein LOC131945035 [Physella acuta]|uniref:uncharacterized protein LOC131945035 n=1 Tax=Physella acuta TaxID=109671 RepID=UPI0027DC1EF0|nr:uncharacterized protein LOC131945035 [Physella acuta]